MKKRTIFKATTKIEGNGSFEVFNKIPENSGLYGLSVEVTLDVANLTADESVSITVDGVEVSNVAANGSYSFKFGTKPFPMHPETFNVGYSVTNAGVADVVLTLIAY
jgi:hypothetical protein